MRFPEYRILVVSQWFDVPFQKGENADFSLSAYALSTFLDLFDAVYGKVLAGPGWHSYSPMSVLDAAAIRCHVFIIGSVCACSSL